MLKSVVYLAFMRYYFFFYIYKTDSLHWRPHIEYLNSFLTLDWDKFLDEKSPFARCIKQMHIF